MNIPCASMMPFFFYLIQRFRSQCHLFSFGTMCRTGLAPEPACQTVSLALCAAVRRRCYQPLSLGLRSHTSQKTLYRLSALYLRLPFICLCAFAAVRNATDDLGGLPLEYTLLHGDIRLVFERHVISHWELEIRFSSMQKGHQVFTCSYV